MPYQIPPEDSYYDVIAPGYDRLHSEEQQRKARIILKHLDFRPDWELLDVGCGTGAATKLFPCMLTGVEPSRELASRASFKVMQAVAQKLPFADKSFDVVICLTVMHLVPNPGRALDEIERVSKQWIVISMLKKSKSHGHLMALIRARLEIESEIDDIHDTIIIARPKSLIIKKYK